MKFKNYVNSYTKNNRIFSKEDIAEMTVREAFKNKKGIISQNRRIGVPSNAELQNSSNVIWVNSYTREDGTPVKGYWRSKGGSGGIVGDTDSVIMDEQMPEPSERDNSNAQSAGDSENGDEDLSPVSLIVDLAVAISQLFFKDSKVGEYIEAFAPIIKTIGGKLFGEEDDELNFETDTAENTETPEIVKDISVPQEMSNQESLIPLKASSVEGLTGGASSFHTGIDIDVKIGTPVKTIADGTVVAANGGMRGYGNGVFIDHGYINGKHVRSEYGHLSKFAVKVGDKVKQGQIVAESGNTGISEGPHLHLTIREYDEEEKTWKAVNPQKYLKY